MKVKRSSSLRSEHQPYRSFGAQNPAPNVHLETIHSTGLRSGHSGAGANKGASLVELLLYTGLLTIVLSVLYQFFIIISYQRVQEVVEHAIFANGRRVSFELDQEIKNAIDITSPAVGGSDSSLSLDGGTVVYSINAQGQLQKNDNGQIYFLTDSQVIVDNITFEHLGPSTEQPTVKITYTLRGAHALEGGRQRTEDFQFASTVR